MKFKLEFTQDLVPFFWYRMVVIIDAHRDYNDRKRIKINKIKRFIFKYLTCIDT